MIPVQIIELTCSDLIIVKVVVIKPESSLTAMACYIFIFDNIIVGMYVFM